MPLSAVAETAHTLQENRLGCNFHYIRRPDWWYGVRYNTFIYSNSQPISSSYSHSFPIKLENREESSGMVSYHMANSETYCTDQKIQITNNIIEKAFHEDIVDDYNDGRPQLHHMPSLSTTCTTDSFPSGDSGDAYELNRTDAQEFEWSMNSANPFQWPPNRFSPPINQAKCRQSCHTPTRISYRLSSTPCLSWKCAILGTHPSIPGPNAYAN